jgi:hypothetical protein
MLHHAAVPVNLLATLERLREPLAGKGFALVGGTSLALRLGHRISVDLDFFTREPFRPDALLDALGLSPKHVMDQSPSSLQLAIAGVKVEFLRHDYPLLEPHEAAAGIEMYSLRDVCAMKLNAITNRGAKKDFFDVAALLGRFPLSGMLDDYCLKYGVSHRFMVIRSLVWFDDAEEEPNPVSLDGTSWEAVKSVVSKSVSEME